MFRKPPFYGMHSSPLPRFPARMYLVARLTAVFLLALRIAAGQTALTGVHDTIKQGDTIQISASPNAVSARMAGRTVKLFNHEGRATGLMPVEVNQTTGAQKLELLDAAGRIVMDKTIMVEHVPVPEQ